MTTKQTWRQSVAERESKELADAIELVTAMHASLARGENLTNAQIAAAFHDSVIGVLYYRFLDYAEYRSRTYRLHRVAFDDSCSIALDKHLQAYFSAPNPGLFVETTREQALVVPGPKRKRAA